MDRKELEAKVIELVEISYGKAAGEVTLETSFKDDLKGASVQMVALVSEIENELDAMVALQDASACETVKDLVDKVEEEMQELHGGLYKPAAQSLIKDHTWRRTSYEQYFGSDLRESERKSAEGRFPGSNQ